MSEEIAGQESEAIAETTPPEGEAVETESTINVESEEATTSEEAPEKPKKQKGVQKRINELTREKYEERQLREQAERELSELRQSQQKQELESQVNAPPPKLEDYQDEPSYYQAVNNWHESQVEATQKAQEEQAERQKQFDTQMEAQRAFHAKMTEAVEKYPDFAMKVNDPTLPPLEQINPTAYQAVLDSDNFADVAYYLANNPAEVYSLQSLNPVQAVKEIAKLEIKLSAKPKPQSQPIAPPSEVGGVAASVKTLYDIDDTDDWMEARNKQLQR